MSPHGDEPEQKLLAAIMRYDPIEVGKLIDAGANANAFETFRGCRRPFLHYALGDSLEQEKTLPIVRLLLAAGADIDGIDEFGDGATPIIAATERHCSRMVRLLIENGANTTLRDRRASALANSYPVTLG
jgi:hypothetical protein